jgi:hypothetical protein
MSTGNEIAVALLSVGTGVVPALMGPNLELGDTGRFYPTIPQHPHDLRVS